MPARSASSTPPASDPPQPAHDTLGQALVVHYEELVGYVRRRFSLGEMARDVVHDAFVRLTGRRPRAMAHNPLGLLHRMLHNLAVDDLRRRDARARHETACDMHAMPEAVCPQPRPEHIVQSRQELHCLIQAIEALPPRCREVFILHKIHGLPQAEVAQLLHISLKSVEKHLRRGVQQCLQRLQADGAR
ncbi:MAG: RNA polymerase sigma factor [Comamonas sp.]|jgi:RNA polymerase sigma-70 factor (ECF subfamily)|nr:RNA polymerase sigma factor [Comamonas sp.]